MGKEAFGRPSGPRRGRKAGRPTPVRELMETAGPPESDEAEEVVLEVDGKHWSTRAIGSGRAGTSPDTAATLLLLAFTDVDEPDAEEREVLVVANALSDLGIEALREAFARSRTRRSESRESTKDRTAERSGRRRRSESM
jgi:hypothetical protein